MDHGSPALSFGEPFGEVCARHAFAIHRGREGRAPRLYDHEPVREGPLARPNPIEEAEQLERAFRESGLRSLAAFANRAAISVPRLSQMLGLLRLPEAVKEHVRRLGPVIGRSGISERELRPIATLPTAAAQLRAAAPQAAAVVGRQEW
jgi:hypothetical protein